MAAAMGKSGVEAQGCPSCPDGSDPGFENPEGAGTDLYSSPGETLYPP